MIHLIHRFQKPVTVLVLALTAIPALAGPPRLSRRSINVRSEQRTRVDVDVDVRRRIDIDIDRRRRPSLGAAAVAGLVTGLVIGKIVSAPPRGYATVYAGPTPLAYYGGVYYQQAPSGYVVVAPPVGVIVPVPPPGATITVVSNTSYYLYNGLYYQPVFVNGVTQYRTVRF